MSLAPGTRLGPYSITAAVGAGGMGEVYRARDSRLERDVAVKVLPMTFATDPSRMARFAREAQLLAALSHPNIAAVYGLEESGGASALVMEFVDGETLAERIARGALPVEEAVGLARQIGEALEAAHDKGIIHRDLKPANIKITSEGKVKVLDFGLAKAMEADPISADPVNSPTLTVQATRAGQIMGTAAYMAPEQARGKAVDRRADIWAFGVVLYEMLTGKSMFEGETVSDTLAAVLRADIDLGKLPADTPPKLRRLIQRCLERDPKRRLRDIGDAWIEFDSPDPVAAPVAVSPFRRWAPWIGAAILAAGGIAWGLLRSPEAPPRPIARFSMQSSALFVAISPDGSTIAWSEGANGQSRLMLRRLDQLEAKPVSGGDGGFFPAFSADGQWLLFSTLASKIEKVAIAGATPVLICDGNTWAGGAWLEDDTIVFSSSKGLRRVPASGGTPEDLTTVDPKKGEFAHTHPQALPNGRVLFTVNESGNYLPAHVAVVDIKTKKVERGPATGLVTRYVPSGHLTYARSGTLFAMPFDLSRFVATGPEAPVIDGISGIGPGGYADYSFSPSGMLAYVAGSTGRQGTMLAWADRKGEMSSIAPDPVLWGTGRLSPDGTRIANGITGTATGRDIWSYDIARHTSIRLSFEGRADFPIWSPDGRRIVYGYDGDNARGLYTVPADGSARPALLLKSQTQVIPTSFAPDGKTVVFSQAVNGAGVVMILAADGQTHPLHQAAAPESAGQVSPDGKWIAYTSFESSTAEVYVQAFPAGGAKVRISTHGGDGARWSRNGRELFYREGNGPAQRVMAVDVHAGPNGFEAGVPHALFSLNAGSTWDVAPDGKRFLVEQITTAASGRLNFVTEWFEELKRRAPAKK